MIVSLTSSSVCGQVMTSKNLYETDPWPDADWMFIKTCFDGLVP
jgi:hypothetical protein